MEKTWHRPRLPTIRAHANNPRIAHLLRAKTNPIY
jgi:hypothetical protein